MDKTPSRPKIKMDIFPTVNKLIEQKPFSAAEVSSILKVELKERKKGEYFTFYEMGRGNNIIKAVELRLPNELSGHKDGLIIVEFSDALKIGLNDLYSEYGKDDWSFYPAPPGAPLSAPHYHSKIIKRQKITFGIDRDNDKLRLLIIDRIN